METTVAETAGQMAEGIVDALEPVKVDHEKRQWALVPVGARQLGIEPLLELAVVWEFRDRITHGQLQDPFVAPRVGDRCPGVPGERL